MSLFNNWLWTDSLVEFFIQLFKTSYKIVITNSQNLLICWQHKDYSGAKHGRPTPNCPEVHRITPNATDEAYIDKMTKPNA